jgi:hypothetical protein
MPTEEPVPRALLAFLADQDELQLQVRALLGDWDALIATAAMFPEPMAAIWRVVYDYLVTGSRPPAGSIENTICAEYVTRCRHQAPPPPPVQPPPPAAEHAFVPEALGVDICQLCKNRANSAIHRPGAPR